jgi:hypothetical protein
MSGPTRASSNDLAGWQVRHLGSCAPIYLPRARQVLSVTWTVVNRETVVAARQTCVEIVRRVRR